MKVLIRTFRKGYDIKISTEFDEEGDVKFAEAALVVFELEKVKKSIIEMDFDADFSMEKSG